MLSVQLFSTGPTSLAYRRRIRTMSEPITLEQIFAAFVRQDTLEDVALEMAGLARIHPEIVDEIYAALTPDIGSGNGQPLIDAVNRSGYRVSNALEAKEFCAELLALFMRQVAI